MTAVLALAPSHKLVTHTGRAFFRLGMLVQDTTGRWLGLTARHIMECEPEEGVYDASTSTLVGSRLATEPAVARHRAFSETIGAFIIDTSSASINLADPLTLDMNVAQPRQAIGRPVFKIESNGLRVEAIAVGYGGSITLIRPDGEEAVYHGVLEISFDEHRRHAVAAGEGGSLVLDEHGAALGLMIAGDGEACCVAPLLPFLEDHGFRVIDSASLLSREGEGDMGGDDGASTGGIADLSTEYRSALNGAKELRSELREENATPDPQDEPVPRRLLELLDVD